MESMGRNDQTVLSEGRAWATCSGYRDDAADVSDADMVQPVEGTEDAIYDSYAMRSFLGINFMTEQVPDATTLLKFRNRRMS